MLEVKGLSKRFGDLGAVKEVSFSLQPGDVFGFIGSNGAGKTTTIRMLATLLEPSSGTALLNGADIVKNPIEVRRQIGFMPDRFGFYDDIRAWEYLDFYATMYRVPKEKKEATINEVLELTDLTFKRDAFVSELSRGMQQRLSLARCLVHDPALLLLDEPASGLDPRARAELKSLIAELGKLGKIVLISSHILPELSDFCNVIGIIERGELLAFGPVKEIIKELKQGAILEIRLLDKQEEASMFLHQQAKVTGTRLEADGRIIVEFDGGDEEAAHLLKVLVENRYPVVEFREEVADLEDVFMKVTTGAVQ
jgi:ABC-2 type transport system ATP-binding protein